ncbi:MAG: hypothetical protein BVN29_09060 [Nitrospira sp. ST-bin5]|nr:MAG: hypothetical protein BVN29_09060 [Nitrospira sp. ST-bin5]
MRTRTSGVHGLADEWVVLRVPDGSTMLTAGPITRNGVSGVGDGTDRKYRTFIYKEVYHVAVDIANFVRSSTAPLNEERC